MSFVLPNILRKKEKEREAKHLNHDDNIKEGEEVQTDKTESC
jgi:hypothetical protein